MLHRRRPSPDYSWVGSCINSFEACSAFTRVTTCRLAKSPYATLYTEGSGGFVASTAAPIATGWSDPVPGRVFPPAVDQRLSRRTVTTCRLTRSPYATLYTGGSGGFVASTAAPIATGWSDPVPGRVFPPAVDQRLSRRTVNACFLQLSLEP